MKAKNTVIGKRKQAHRENRQRCECGHVKYNHIGNGRCCAPTCFCKNFIPEVLPKPSDIFEGENSSLKKTFDNATMPPLKQTELRDLLSKELDNLENAISDDNKVLSICSREHIWKLIDRLLSLALQEKIKEVEKIQRKIKESNV